MIKKERRRRESVVKIERRAEEWKNVPRRFRFISFSHGTSVVVCRKHVYTSQETVETKRDRQATLNIRITLLLLYTYSSASAAVINRSLDSMCSSVMWCCTVQVYSIIIIIEYYNSVWVQSLFFFSYLTGKVFGESSGSLGAPPATATNNKVKLKEIFRFLPQRMHMHWKLAVYSSFLPAVDWLNGEKEKRFHLVSLDFVRFHL